MSTVYTIGLENKRDYKFRVCSKDLIPLLHVPGDCEFRSRDSGEVVQSSHG